MLVLSRKSGSAIAVGDDIEIEVLAIRGNQVKIGIRAPEAVAIVRSELKAQPSARITPKALGISRRA